MREVPYSSRRSAVYAANAVATSQPLATQAGIDALRAGGTAIDGALAAAITLTVVEPTSNGIGSDAFALVWDGERLHGFNGSGRAPAAWTPERFASHDAMPKHGWDAVTVPGAVDAWVQLWRRFGRLKFERLCEPAIGYARDGYPVSPVTAQAWARAPEAFAAFPEFLAHFCPGGRSPRPGDRFASPDQARTLEAIAATEGEAFYRGELARAVAADATGQGGGLTIEDLATHRGTFVEPIAIDYRGIDLHEIPPNGQGLAALIALGILRHLDVARAPADSASSLHLQIEAMKIGLAEIAAHLADPEAMAVSPARLLDPDALRVRADVIDPERASAPVATEIPDRGTVTLAAADAAGRMVSFIQSNFCGFGSGIVVPGTGIALQNRGHGFSLAPGHPNQVGPKKLPYHTIIPGLATRDGAPWLAFGVMGGHMQAQGHLQMMVRLHDYGQNPQAASDAPRWFIQEDGQIALEASVPREVADGLRARGHSVVHGAPESWFGGAQLIHRLPDGVYCAGSDHRKDGAAAGF